MRNATVWRRLCLLHLGTQQPLLHSANGALPRNARKENTLTQKGKYGTIRKSLLRTAVARAHLHYNKAKSRAMDSPVRKPDIRFADPGLNLPKVIGSQNIREELWRKWFIWFNDRHTHTPVSSSDRMIHYHATSPITRSLVHTNTYNSQLPHL